MDIKHYIIFSFQILCFSSFEAFPSGKNTTLVFEILNDRNVLQKSSVIKSIWEGEPSTLCDIQKPSESVLANKVFIDFNHVPVLCMVLFDASLRYLQLNMSHNEDTKFDYTEIINGTSTDTICEKMTKNVWSTAIGENKNWVSKFNDIMKNENSCQGFCVTQIVNPLCQSALWLDSAVKQEEEAISKISRMKNPGKSGTNFKNEPFQTDTRIDLVLSPTKQEGDSHTSSKDMGPNYNNRENKLQNVAKVDTTLKNGGNPAINKFLLDSGKVTSFPKLTYQTGNQKPHIDAIATAQGETTELLHFENTPGNSEKDKTKKKPLTKSPSVKSVHVPGTDNIRPNNNRAQDNSRTEPSTEELQTVKGSSSSVRVLEKPEPVSALAGKSNEKPEEKSQERTPKTSEGPVTVQAGQDKTIRGSTQVTGSQKTYDISAAGDIPKTSAPVSVPFPKHKENDNPDKDVQTPPAPVNVLLPEPKGNNSPDKEGVNTTDPEVKEKEKAGISEGHKAGIPKPLDQLEKSENGEANEAELPEIDGNPVGEPDDHEDQKKLDDGAMVGQVEDGNHLGGHGDANLPQESDDDTVDIQDNVTEEPRFGEMEEGAPPKPDPSIKVEDYAGSSDEDEDSQWHPDQGRVTQNDADAGYAHDRFVDAEDSHFFAYFMTMIILCILGYIIFHNKQKILALALEGRVRKGSRRRPSTSGYRKLDSNLEEAVTSNCTGSSVTHVIY